MHADAVLFDEHLKSIQIYNLAKLTGIEVIDRDKIILDIFSKRALTTEAKLQVALAELRYEMPRAREKVRMARMGEQPGFFGLGRYEVDVYYRSIRRRISSISKKLRSVGKRRKLHRQNRVRYNMPAISIAGYTGVGKTTLFNLLTGESNPIAGEVFTTLTTTTRAALLSSSKVLISDTVGFISRLPEYVVEAFKSTLEELVYADLVLLVMDISDNKEDMRSKYWESISITSELGVSPSKTLLVFNKADTVTSEDAEEIISSVFSETEHYVLISAVTGFGINKLKSMIDTFIFHSTDEISYGDNKEVTLKEIGLNSTVASVMETKYTDVKG